MISLNEVDDAQSEPFMWLWAVADFGGRSVLCDDAYSVGEITIPIWNTFALCESTTVTGDSLFSCYKTKLKELTFSFTAQYPSQLSSKKKQTRLILNP